MRLRPNPIDQLHPTAIDLIHELDHRLHLRVVGVQVEVVDVELRGRVGRAGHLEGGGDEGVAEDVGEDGGAEGAVLVEDFAEGELAMGRGGRGTDVSERHVLDDVPLGERRGGY